MAQAAAISIMTSEPRLPRARLGPVTRRMGGATAVKLAALADDFTALASSDYDDETFRAVGFRLVEDIRSLIGDTTPRHAEPHFVDGIVLKMIADRACSLEADIGSVGDTLVRAEADPMIAYDADALRMLAAANMGGRA